MQFLLLLIRFLPRNALFAFTPLMFLVLSSLWAASVYAAPPMEGWDQGEYPLNIPPTRAKIFRPPQSAEDGESDDSDITQISFPLPQNLSSIQRQIAQSILAEETPKISAMQQKMQHTLGELRNLSFRLDTPPEQLGVLGQQLVNNKNAVLEGVKRLSKRMEKEAGFNPGWESRRRTYIFHRPIDN